jgi:hypothetical protein
MKYQMYDVLSELEKSYPFTPEQLRYAPVDAKLQEPQSPSNYRWLEDTDELVDAEGKHIDKNSKLLSVVPSGLVHVNQPEIDEELWHLCTYIIYLTPMSEYCH